MATTITTTGWLPGILPVETVTAYALEVLRLAADDVDADRVARAAQAALDLIEDYLDRADDPLTAPCPQPIIEAAVQVTIELYRRKDAPFGVLDTWSESDFGPVRLGTDWIKGVEAMLRPYRATFGVW